jgi:nucleoside-diphosphate-sugar epimerase
VAALATTDAHRGSRRCCTEHVAGLRFEGVCALARILVSGCRGLIGSALSAALRAAGHATVGIDLRGDPGDQTQGDIRDIDLLARRIDGCDGVVHLAAISRVAWSQRQPALCWEINVTATQRVLDAALSSPHRPWVLFASSREVYGEPEQVPVDEDCAICPRNIFGRSKVEGERITLAAREAGLATAVVRFSNVYGTTTDHADRVVPAFARGAALGGTLRICGQDTRLDFTHVDDAVRGAMAVIEQLLANIRTLLPVQFVTGQGTSLGELAELARAASGRRIKVLEAPPQGHYVARFVGDPSRARALFGWRPQIDIADGMARLIRAFADEAGLVVPPAPSERQKTSSLA